MIYANGIKYEGHWAKDKQHGEGKEYLPDGTMKSGIWEKGVHIARTDVADNQN